MAKYDEWLTPDGLLRLEAWARDGLTYEQIAKNCGVGLTTLKRWRKDHRPIWAALKKGKKERPWPVESVGLSFAHLYHKRG
jgi:hypothetical protein